MKILTTRQIRAADQYSIQHLPISSIDLMEKASKAFSKAYLNLGLNDLPVTVICGPGNNGGDGLAIARLLLEHELLVNVCLVREGIKLSDDCKINLDRWLALGEVIRITESEDLPNQIHGGVIIDALFGSGISRGITGHLAQVIQQMNQAESKVVSVDMPSGLFADQPNPEGAIVQADYTISFQTPKLAFFLPQNFEYVGEWQIVDIGLDKEFIEKQESNWYTIDTGTLSEFIHKPSKFAHKGNFGHGLLVAGSEGKIGAAILAARAALRGGLGLLTVHIPKCGYNAMQTAVPEVMCQLDEHPQFITSIPSVAGYQAVGVGPGIGQSSETVKALSNLLEQVDHPMVIDADGLNILGEHRDLLKQLPVDSILTPHPGEFKRLVGEFRDDYHRLDIQQQFAQANQVILLCKGAYTAVATPDGRLFFNTTGNPGMATAGSGDVLTGLITGLLTRNGDPLMAALIGVFLHGAAGDIASEAKSEVSLIAGDIIEQLGTAIRKLNLQL